jgi:hypothetical protein
MRLRLMRTPQARADVSFLQAPPLGGLCAAIKAGCHRLKASERSTAAHYWRADCRAWPRRVEYFGGLFPLLEATRRLADGAGGFFLSPSFRSTSVGCSFRIITECHRGVTVP